MLHIEKLTLVKEVAVGDRETSADTAVTAEAGLPYAGEELWTGPQKFAFLLELKFYNIFKN